MNKTFVFAIIFVIGTAALVSPSYSEYLPPNKQLESGVLPEDIQCRENRVLAIRDNSNMACVYNATAEKMNWQLISLSESSTIQTKNSVLSEIDYGTTTVTLIKNGTQASMSNFCSEWPKNFAVQFPNTVKIGKDFDITLHYTNILYDDEDILESKRNNEPIVIEDAVKRLKEKRVGCFDTFVYFGINDKTTLITDHVLDDPITNPETQRVTNYYHIEYPFNNTVKQIQKATLRIDSLPDRYDSNLLVGTQSGKVRIYHFVDDSGILFLNSPQTKNTDISFSSGDIVPILNERFSVIPINEEGSVRISNVCDDGWPTNLSVDVPRQIETGVPFDINISYAFAIYDDEDIAESQITGIPIPLEDAIDYDDFTSSSCPEFLFIDHSNKTKILSKDFSLRNERFSELYHKTNLITQTELPFTENVTETITVTMVVNEALDLVDGELVIGTEPNTFVRLYGETYNNFTMFFDLPIPQVRDTLMPSKHSVKSAMSILGSYQSTEIPTYETSTEDVLVPQPSDYVSAPPQWKN